MKVRFKTHYRGFHKDRVYDLADGVAQLYILRGRAVEEKAIESAPEDKAIDAAPEDKAIKHAPETKAKKK